MTPLDLTPATETLAALVAGVRDDQLGAGTPCPDYTLGDLLDHVGGLAVAFTLAARKEATSGGPPPSGDASRLEPGWRDRLHTDLGRLAEAWQDPGAWDGATAAGGFEMPGDVAGVVALGEVVLHGWDVARATGAVFAVDPALLVAVHEHFALFSGPGSDEMRAGGFGPVVEVHPGRPLLDKVVAMAGRDPDA